MTIKVNCYFSGIHGSMSGITFPMKRLLVKLTNKTDLAHRLESCCSEVPTELPQISASASSAYINGMAIVRSLNENHFKTFRNLAEAVILPHWSCDISRTLHLSIHLFKSLNTQYRGIQAVSFATTMPCTVGKKACCW